MRIIADLESDGLLDTITKIHCFSYYNLDTKESVTLTNYKDIANLFSNPDLTWVGHNIVRFDAPAIRKIIKVPVKCRLIDTLGISWYLFPKLIKHGLEEWGEFFKVPKPEIKDWNNLSSEEYQYRCQEDVKINTLLFTKFILYLKEIYRDEIGGVDRILNYIWFKLDCAKEQEEVKIKLAVSKTKENLAKLNSLKIPKIKALQDVMPPEIEYKIISRPAKLTKKDGEQSEAGKKWFKLLQEQNLDENHIDAVTIESSRTHGNATSFSQLKDWLFSLGWEPIIFKTAKSKKTGISKEVPQLGQDGKICDSIKSLYEKEPALENLEGLFILNHRIGILEGYLEVVDENGYVIAEIAGLTNTLRFKHKKPIVNLPGVLKPYGQEIRECLICEDDEILFNSDCSGLENLTRNNFIYDYDPKYVEDMNVEGFDSHLDLGVNANLITQEESDYYKWYDKDKSDKTLEQKEKFNAIKKKRHLTKTTNYACIYGAMPPKLAKTAKVPLSEAKLIYKAYWQRNWAVKKVGTTQRIKIVNNQMWQFNPISKFWYSLRFEKDSFSTLNQGTADYVFNVWLKHLRADRVKLCMQYHDECSGRTKKENKEIISQKLQKAMDKTNEELKLNVQFAISIEFGKSYADCH